MQDVFLPTETEPLAASPKRRRGHQPRLPGGDDATAAAIAGLSPPLRAAAHEHADGLSPSGRFSLGDSLMEAVIKVFATHSEPNYSLPWQRKRQFASSGSGFAISGHRILTNAHCVDHQTQVRVKRRGSDTKYVAKVLSVGAECDIAMLTVDDEEFWEGLEPVAFGQLPCLQDNITVVGYPVGGETQSVTAGVISRVETTQFVHGATELLGLQVDAAINSGNSGGPAFNDRGQCVGIAFQSLKNEDIENISYIIPTPVINHFIADYERHGKYTGFPSLGCEWQKTESPVLRKALGLKAGERGVLVRRIEPTSPASAVLSKGDVILSFDGIAIGSDGTVPFRSGERIGFSYLVSQKMTGDSAVLRILHDRKVKQVEVVLRPPKRLIPVHIDNNPPSYYIVGGLVFTPVTIPLLRSEYGKEFDFEAPVKLLEKMMHAMAENETQQIVVLSQVLAADVNVGFDDIVNTQVAQVNGQKINNLVDLVHAVESDKGKYMQFDLEYNQMVILDKAEAIKATPEILLQHCIPADRSEDLILPVV